MHLHLLQPANVFREQQLHFADVAQQETCAVGSGRELLWQVGRNERGSWLVDRVRPSFQRARRDALRGSIFEGFVSSPRYHKTDLLLPGP